MSTGDRSCVRLHKCVSVYMQKHFLINELESFLPRSVVVDFSQRRGSTLWGSYSAVLAGTARANYSSY